MYNTTVHAQQSPQLRIKTKSVILMLCLGCVGWLVVFNVPSTARSLFLLETAPPFTVPCEGLEARQIHRYDRELNPGPSHGSPLRYRCATQAPLMCCKSLKYGGYCHYKSNFTLFIIYQT